jgi:cobalt/nickel transport system ATP-binding protein
MNVFELDDVTFAYDAAPVLNGITLRIPRGQRIAILGANGSGKSTLMRLFGALSFPASGHIRFQGAPLDEASLRSDEDSFDFRRRVGMVFQNPDVQLFNPTVFDELAFGPLQLRWPAPRIRERVDETLEQFGIAHLHDRSPHRLSGGEKKRVCLASVLILDPEVLLLDEPTAALDPNGQNVMIDLLHRTANDARTVLIATHDLGIVEDVADRCVVLQAGRVVAEGAAADIVRDTDLLRRTGLLHVHRHAHPGGIVHSHPHEHHGHVHPA